MIITTWMHYSWKCGLLWDAMFLLPVLTFTLLHYMCKSPLKLLYLARYPFVKFNVRSSWGVALVNGLRCLSLTRCTCSTWQLWLLCLLFSSLCLWPHYQSVPVNNVHFLRRAGHLWVTKQRKSFRRQETAVVLTPVLRTLQMAHMVTHHVPRYGL